MGSMTTFGAFTAARLGMYASMKGLDVTGHNIANINTRGYSRQRLDQSALKVDGSDRYYSIYDARVGSGVLTTGISQIRDPYLDIRYRTENASVGAADAKLGILETINGVLDEISKNKDTEGVLNKQLADLEQQLQKLKNGVGQQENDTLVRASAASLVSILNSFASALKGTENNTITSFKQDITRVNEILDGIRGLNDTIRNSEIHGDSALELKDQRNLLLDELSQYVKIDVTYEKEDLGAGVIVSKLVVNLADDNKTELINGQYSGKLSITQKDKRNPNYDPAQTDPTKPDFGEYLDVDGKGTNNQADAAQVDSDYYKLQVSALEDRNGTILAGSVSKPLDETLNGSLQATRQMLSAAGEFSVAGSPFPTNMRGIPYYRKVLDSLANQLATQMNELNRPYQVDKDGNYLDKDGNILVNGSGDNINKNKTLTDAEWVIVKNEDNRNLPYITDKDGYYVKADGTHITNADGKLHKDAALTNADWALIRAERNQSDGILFSTNNADPTNPHAGITAENISISDGWSKSQTQITISAVFGNTSTDGSNVEHIIAAFTKSFDYLPSSVGGSSNTPMFSGSFKGMLGNIGSTLAKDTSSTITELNNHVTLADSIESSRYSTSSVDLNDEAANMMQYQKSYAAACRLMTTIDEALDKLINGMGVVGR